MKKIILFLAAFAAASTMAVAETDYIANTRIDAMLSGEQAFTVLNVADVTVSDDLVVTDDASVGGDLSVTPGTITAGGACTAASFSGALAEGDIVYNAGSAAACSYTDTVTDIDSVYLDGPPLLGLVVTDAVATATFNIASVPGTPNMARQFTIVNTTTSTVTLGHNSLLYPAADITMEQYGTVTIAGLYTNMWLLTVDNTP